VEYGDAGGAKVFKGKESGIIYQGGKKGSGTRRGASEHMGGSHLRKRGGSMRRSVMERTEVQYVGKGGVCLRRGGWGEKPAEWGLGLPIAYKNMRKEEKRRWSAFS